MAANRPRVYVETTVWNFLFAEDAPEHRDATRIFFDEVRRGLFETCISDVVIAELRAASEPKRSQLLRLVGEIGPVGLYSSDESDELAARFIARGMVPEKYGNDALHIAIAVVEGVDALLSWNFKHIVKMKTNRLVSEVCREAGYEQIEIRTPEEVINEDEE
jgi:predicted nucleic acid-binding protein